MLKIDLYNQWDQAWGAKSLGGAVVNGLQVTMANSGCYLTSIAMILSNLGVKVTPGELCDKLNASNGFTSDGMVKWDAVMRLFPWIYWYESQWTTRYTKAKDIVKVQQDVGLKHVRKLVSMGFPVLLCVDHVGNDQWPDHAVVVKEAPEDLKAWKIHDPDGGMNISFLDRYGSPDTGVYGYRVLLGPPQSFPDASPEILKSAALTAWKLSQLRKAYDNLPGKLKMQLPAEITTYAIEALDDLLA